MIILPLFRVFEREKRRELINQFLSNISLFQSGDKTRVEGDASYFFHFSNDTRLGAVWGFHYNLQLRRVERGFAGSGWPKGESLERMPAGCQRPEEGDNHRRGLSVGLAVPFDQRCASINAAPTSKRIAHNEFTSTEACLNRFQKLSTFRRRT